MTENILISGFADEIDADLATQLQTINELGMKYICLRAANGKNIADYTTEEVETELKPVLDAAGVQVSSLGSPIGKIELSDQEAYEKQTETLKKLCETAKILGTKYIRIFSFFVDPQSDYQALKEDVVSKLKVWADIAEENGIVLIHENEKDIYGDTAPRELEVLEGVNSPSLKAAFDFANFVQVGQNPLEAWDLIKDHVAYIHIKDAVSTSSENVLCGTGEGCIQEIITKALEGGYKGFATLEPHLVLFDSLQSLEKEDAKDIIKEDKYENGAQGFTAQHDAFVTILNEIEKRKGE